MFLLAQASIDLAQYGALGIMVAALFTFAYRAYDREAKRADRLEQENNRLRKHAEENVIPLLVRAMDVLEHSSHRHSQG